MKIEHLELEPGGIDKGGAPTFYRVTGCDEGKPIFVVGEITFQSQPIPDGINGLTNEVLLAMIIDRLDGFSKGPYPSIETSIAKTKCEEALMWLRKRTQDRRDRGVEGKYEK